MGKSYLEQQSAFASVQDYSFSSGAEKNRAELGLVHTEIASIIGSPTYISALGERLFKIGGLDMDGRHISISLTLTPTLAAIEKIEQH